MLRTKFASLQAFGNGRRRNLRSMLQRSHVAAAITVMILTSVMSCNYGNFRPRGEFVELHCARGLHPQLPVEGATLDGFGNRSPVIGLESAQWVICFSRS